MEDPKKNLPPIYIVSGGKGIAGEIMVQSTLIQFPDNRIPVVIVPDVITDEKLNQAIDQARTTGGIIVHTMVDTKMRNKLKQRCAQVGVKEIDMMGELSDYVSQLLGVEPVCVPGLYRKVNQEYFDRIASIEFTLSHDDGLNSHKIFDADVVITGVSRVGKTPLSIYMAMFGWKVANIPLFPDVDPPADLNWDLWLGPLHPLPFNWARFKNGQHRYFAEIVGSWLREMGPHILDLPVWALDMKAPKSASADSSSTTPAPPAIP